MCAHSYLMTYLLLPLAVFLRAHNNVLSGTIPGGIGRLTRLRELYLSKNEMFSDIPLDIGLMEDLEDLRVNENEMYGAIPGSLYNLRKMKKLWLQDTLRCEQLADFSWDCRADSDSGFVGSIQTDIGNLKRLSQLLINRNPVSGTLPTELGLCEELCKCMSILQFLCQIL